MAWGLTDKELGLSKKDKDKYSVNRALAVLASPHSQSARKEAGFELDLSEQVCKRDNKEARGVIIPQEILDHGYRSTRPSKQGGHILTDQVVRGVPPPSHIQKRAVPLQKRTTLTSGTDATAGYLVDDELQSVISVLVENTLALQNVPSYNVMGDPIYFPRQTARVEPTWKAETGAADESNPTYDRVSFTAKHLKCLVPISRTLLIQANNDVDDFVRGDIAIGMAKALDTAMLYGTGANNQPQGVKGTSDIVSVTYAAATAYEKVLDTWADIGVNNIPSRNLRWIASWKFLHECRRRQKLGLYSRVPILDEDGTIDGVPIEVSSQVTGTTSQKAEGFLADWLEAALVLWQDLEIDIDPYSKLDQGIVRFVATLILDFNVLRPKAFGRLGGA